MKKVIIIKSIKDLAAVKAEEICDKSKPYYQTFVEGMEKKIVDDLIDNAIIRENQERVSPILLDYFNAGNICSIPVSFEMDGRVYTQIKKVGYSLEVSCDGEYWHYLSGKDEIRLYETLEAAGCLDSLD